MAAHQAVAAALPDTPEARQTRPVQSAGKPGEEALRATASPPSPSSSIPSPMRREPQPLARPTCSAYSKHVYYITISIIIGS